jgi:hypothetical protein
MIQSDESGMELSTESKSSVIAKKIATAAILAGMSVAISPVVSFLPRHPWQIAYFDPVSLFWIVSFLVGGVEVGLLSTTIGAIALIPFDPSGVVGPLYKFLATLPMIVIPWLGTKIRKQGLGGEYLSRPIPYFALMVIAFIARLAIMIPLNLYMAPLFVPGVGVTEIILVTLLVNSTQSALDAAIPFIVVHPSGVFRHFGMW